MVFINTLTTLHGNFSFNFNRVHFIILSRKSNNVNVSFRTFLVGYGTPPSDRFSYLVIMIISIGFGIPLFILLATGIYICIRKPLKRRNDTYLGQ